MKKYKNTKKGWTIILLLIILVASLAFGNLELFIK